MKKTLLSLMLLPVLATGAQADTPDCVILVAPSIDSMVRWTECIPNEFHAPRGPKITASPKLKLQSKG